MNTSDRSICPVPRNHLHCRPVGDDMGLHFSPLNRGGVGERPETPYRALQPKPCTAQRPVIVVVGWMVDGGLWRWALTCRRLKLASLRIMNLT